MAFFYRLNDSLQPGFEYAADIGGRFFNHFSDVCTGVAGKIAEETAGIECFAPFRACLRNSRGAGGHTEYYEVKEMTNNGNAPISYQQQQSQQQGFIRNSSEFSQSFDSSAANASALAASTSSAKKSKKREKSKKSKRKSRSRSRSRSKPRDSAKFTVTSDDSDSDSPEALNGATPGLSSGRSSFSGPGRDEDASTDEEKNAGKKGKAKKTPDSPKVIIG